MGDGGPAVRLQPGARRGHRDQPGHELPDRPAVQGPVRPDDRPGHRAGPPATFTLGQRSTSVLELTGAMGAVANDGVFCPPTPILAVTDAVGNPVRVQAPGLQPAVRLLHRAHAGEHHGQRHQPGRDRRHRPPASSATGTATAAARWPVKTGTNNSWRWTRTRPRPRGRRQELRALVRRHHPDAGLGGRAGQPGQLPWVQRAGVTANNNGSDTFGAYAVPVLAAGLPAGAAGPAVELADGGLHPGQPGGPGDRAVDRRRQPAADHDGWKVKVVTNYTCGSKVPAGQRRLLRPAHRRAGSDDHAVHLVRGGRRSCSCSRPRRPASQAA